ncbi:MAG: hypothetical protein IJ932_05390 [Ruminococcus sp.]|nr:hypothetical protein [Ruminococcus sp.]
MFAISGANLEKRTTKVKKPEILLSKKSRGSEPSINDWRGLSCEEHRVFETD